MDPITILVVGAVGVWLFKKSRSASSAAGGGLTPTGGGGGQIDNRERDQGERGTRVITPVLIGTIDNEINGGGKAMPIRASLVSLYNEAIPGGNVEGPGNEYGVCSVIESAVNYGLAPASPNPGNTAARATAGLPPLGATRLTAIKTQVQAIMEELRKG